jgi:hypothetical protein
MFFITTPCTGKSGKDRNIGNYISISHGYDFHGGLRHVEMWANIVFTLNQTQSNMHGGTSKT